jgi:hypothetical protein
MRPPTRFYFLTPVWGDAYTRLYLDVVIPAQLAAGNLPAFKDAPGSRYVIFTRPADRETIRAAPIFKLLTDTIAVSFELIEEEIKAVHDMMSDCYRRGIAAAEEADAAVLLLTPDLVFADGAFATLRRLADAGKDVVFIAAIRTLKQSLMLALQQDYKNDRIIGIEPRDLVRLALDNMHPLAESSLWEEGDDDLIPANLYWRVRNEGIIARCFHLHPVLVNSQRKNVVFLGTVDDDFFCAACPDAGRDHVVTDSDELFAIELSDPERFFPTSFTKGCIADVAEWAEQFTHVRHRKLFDATIRMHTGSRTLQAWEEVEARVSKTAHLVKQELSQSTWRLLLARANTRLLRRLIRRSNDLDLQLANQPRQAKIRLLPSLLTIGLIRTLQGAVRSVRKLRAFISGTVQKPRLFTFDFVYSRFILRSWVLTEVEDIFLVAKHPEGARMMPALEITTRSISLGTIAKMRERLAFVDRKGSAVVASASQRFLALEDPQNEPHDLKAILAEAKRVLAPGGRLLVLVTRLAPRFHTRSSRFIPLETVRALLEPDFRVIQQSVQGNMPLFVWLRVRRLVGDQLRRRPALLHVAQCLDLLLSPLRALGGAALNAVLLLGGNAGPNSKYYISSLTLAEASGHIELASHDRSGACIDGNGDEGLLSETRWLPAKKRVGLR